VFVDEVLDEEVDVVDVDLEVLLEVDVVL